MVPRSLEDVSASSCQWFAENVLLRNRRLAETNLVQIDAAVVAVGLKDAEIQLAGTDEISLANLDHHAEHSDALPGSVQELARQGVEREVDAFAIRLAQDVVNEGRVAGVEDAVSRQTKRLHEIRDLFFIAYRGVDLGANHLRKLDGREADTTTGTVDENGLEACQRPHMTTILESTNLSLLQITNVEDGVNRRGKNARHRCRVFERQVVGNLLAQVLRHNNSCSECTVTDEHDTVTSLQALDLRSGAAHNASGLKAEAILGRLHDAHGAEDILRVKVSDKGEGQCNGLRLTLKFKPVA